MNRIVFLLLTLFFSQAAQADVFSDMIRELAKQTTLQGQIASLNQKIADAQQQSLDKLSNTAGLDFSRMDFKPDMQTWGNNLNHWQNLLNAYRDNHDALGNTAQNLNQEFPIQPSSVANPDPQSLDAKYYTLQAKTALAARAASQHDYESIQKQIDYMHSLLNLIGKTQTVKDALDLQNRIQVENSLIQLEILRLSSLSNQQQAIQTQGQVNAYINNANTFK